jgi:diguanylate cyclase (GGDEF)-like protein/PAS domain S-box-containing protein
LATQLGCVHSARDFPGVPERPASVPEVVLRHVGGALDVSTDPVYITDHCGRFEYVNGAFEVMSGFATAELVGRSVSMLRSGRDGGDSFSRMWQMIGQGEAFAGEVIYRRGDGGHSIVDLVLTPFRSGADEAPKFMGLARDVTARRKAERQLEDLAYYDPLTGLANARLLRERSGQMLALTRRRGSIAAMLTVHLAGLRSVRAQHGRVAADDAVRAMAERLRQGLRDSDTVARTRADEFRVLLAEVTDASATARVVRRLHDSVSRPVHVRRIEIPVTARIGVAMYPQDAGTFEELVECCDIAAQRAAQTGSMFEFFERTMSEASHDQLALEDDLHWAWEHDQFILHYQPIIGSDGTVVGAEALTRGDVVGVEALARWPHASRGVVGPAEFIPLAERTGRILSLDRWAIATAARQAARWLQEGWAGWISVNLSSRTLHNPELPDFIGRTIATHGLPPGRLAVEITESTAMRDPNLTAAVLHELRALGVLIALDDFGVGHSSLAYLKLFPVDLLKLDASFVHELGTTGRDEHLVEIMIDLAHRLGARVVAEGVEEEAQLRWLRNAGCDYIQGYLVGRPAPPDVVPTAPLVSLEA